MFILSALLQAAIVSIVVIIVILIPILFILGKLKNKDKISLKGVKTVVFNLNELVEDYMISTISLNKALSHEALLKALENLVNDKKIEKIIIDVDEVDLSRVHIEEIKEIFEKLSVNKKIIAIGTTFDEYSYQIALLANKIYMLNTKQSCLYFRGYEYKEPYFKNILATFGVTVNTLHIGDYKVAGESFSNDKMSEEKKESLINIKETLFQNFINLVKEKRKVDITNEIFSGDLIFANSEKAIQLGLIDGLSTYEEIGIDYNEDTVDFGEYISAYKRKKNKSKNKSKNTIAIINLEGEIDTRESKESIINYDNVIEKLDELEDIKNLKGLVLRINSPGGSALESEKIYQKLKKLEIPIYISMGDLCASGGYYIATVGKKLFANPVTLTGSIGVVVLYPEFTETINKLKVNMEGFSKGKGFDIFDVSSKLSEESKEKIIYSMNEVYSEFKEHVMEARNISGEDLEKIAGGRVWLGSQAKENGLVDELGSLNDCIDSLAKDLKLKDFKLTYIRGKKSIMEIVSAMKPQFIKSDIIEKIEMLKSYSNKILYYDESLENF